MDELEAIRETCRQIQEELLGGTMETSTAIHYLAKDIDTLTHWIIQIAKKLEMV